MIAKKNRWLALTFVAVGFTGCGGNSEGPGAGSSPVVGTQTQPPPPAGRGTVMVTATDVLGAPLVGATVSVSTSGAGQGTVITDASGRAELKDVIASTINVTVWSPNAFGQASSVVLAADATVGVDIVAMPWAEASGGIARASVPAGGVSSDGRALEFTLQILQVGGEYWSFATEDVQVSACTPRPGNDELRFRPDCVAGTDGYDASYEGSAAISIRRVAATASAAPRSIVLLMDQGTGMVSSDPADVRLLAAKYFLARSNPGDRAALAAFSGDWDAFGQFSLLPRRPVTFLPWGNPQFTTDGRSLFAAIDTLGTQEGGSSPLLAAIDEALDFAASNALEDAKTLVVVTNGNDDTCGTRSECRELVDALVQESKEKGVSIVTVGLGGAANESDHEMLGLLSQATTRGAAFGVQDPHQLSTTLWELPSMLADNKDALEATFRIQSAAEGTFAPGRAVIGEVTLRVCPWDCYYTKIPFVVQIP